MRIMDVLRRCAAVSLAIVAIAGVAHAQADASIIVGKVTSDNGTPVTGVTIALVDMGLASASGDDGSYVLTVPGSRVKGQTTRLVARRIGFAPVNQTVTISAGRQTVDLVMKQDVARLEEMVVTGVAGATSAKNLTISVTSVNEDQINKVPASSPIAALAGKVPGAHIEATNGAPGQAPSIRLRASTNLTPGNNSPLIVVDGVITKSSLADIDANDIERIEVLKGAASSNTYGSDAANGVIAITTKRGKSLPEDKLTFTTRNEFGFSHLAHGIPLNKHHDFQLNADGTDFLYDADGAVLEEPDKIADNPYPTKYPWRNQLLTWVRDGQYMTNYATMGIRRATTNFTTSYSRATDQGIMPMLNGFQRQNFRLNLDQGVTDKADFSASVLYGISDNDQPDGLLGTGTFFGLLQAPGDVDLRHPYGGDSLEFNRKLPPQLVQSDRGNPLYDLANGSYQNRRDRMVGTVSGRYRPLKWLSFDGSYNTDKLNQRIQNYAFRGYQTGSGAPGTGSLYLTDVANTAQNTQVNATARNQFGDLLSTLRLTFLGESENNNYMSAGGATFNAGATPVLGALQREQVGTSSGLQTIRAQNYFATQQLDYRDRYLAQFMIRRDGSSLFGSNARWSTFYGLSGAYRITQDVTIPGFQELKVRAARGTAGVRPHFSDQYETYTVSSGQFSKWQMGNPNLRPAVQTENEVGLSGAFLDHFDFDVVGSQRRTVGAFLNLPVSPAKTGGFHERVENAATVSGRTIELSLNTRVVTTPDWDYSFTLTADRTRQHVDELGRSSFKLGADDAQGQDIFYYKSGEALGVVYGTKWVRSLSQISQMGLDPSLYMVNEDGYVVKKSTYGTVNELPIALVLNGQRIFKIADVNPDFGIGTAHTVRYKAFTAYGLVDGMIGGDIYNFTKQWMFQDLRAGDIDQAGKKAKKPIGYYATGFYNALDPNAYFVESGTYLKLRELSLAYEMGHRALEFVRLGNTVSHAKIALIGRNLYTWTKYTGMDPEAAAGGDLNFRIDGFRYPTFRQITGQIELTF
jgi:TonB-linked SusC/RagA family outer membrane protein